MQLAFGAEGFWSKIKLHRKGSSEDLVTVQVVMSGINFVSPSFIEICLDLGFVQVF